MFSLFRKRSSSLFSAEEKEAIAAAIVQAEKQTSGEIRVFIENKCRFIEATDRAVELFHQLNMHQTAERNGVLLYLAITDRQLAIWGDQGIHEKLGSTYWSEQVNAMLAAFNRADYTAGICTCILEIGNALQLHFPYQGEKDKNELDNEVVFG
ncbi:MAG: hypothetical protein RLZ05_1409 [Bacteroidota bacterium]